MDTSKEPDYTAIGKRILQARKKTGITQEKLSELVDLSTTHMSHVENGTTKVSLSKLILIANVLHTTVDGLLYDNLDVMQEAYDKEFKDLVEDCTFLEKQFIYDAAVHTKEALRLKEKKQK